MREDYHLDISTERVMTRINKSRQSKQKEDMVEIDGINMHLATSMAIFGNGGMTTLPGTSRASRFYGYVYKNITLKIDCDAIDHRVYTIGDMYRGLKAHGKILAMAYKKRSRGLHYPAKVMCKCAGPFRVLWVKDVCSKTGKHSIIKVKL